MVPKFCSYRCLTKSSAKLRLSNGNKVVKPGKRTRGAQCQGELDCLHEQFGSFQYVSQFQQVLFIKGSIVTITCREDQRSNWDKLTKEPGNHGICMLEIQLNFWTVSGREDTHLRDTVPAPGKNNDWEDGETFFQSKRFQ